MRYKSKNVWIYDADEVKNTFVTLFIMVLWACSTALKNTILCLLQSLRNIVSANTTDACETRDPCQHGGICISTDSGPICECRTGDYEGVYCEKGKNILFFRIKKLVTFILWCSVVFCLSFFRVSVHIS